MAYRFVTNINGENYLYEDNYRYQPISKIDSGRVAILPITIEIDNGPKVSITESDLIDYPGMYLSYTGNNCLDAYRPGN